MFLGHFAAGFAAKSAAPRVSLGTTFLAAQALDLLWPTLLIVGLEQVAIRPGATRVTPLEFVSYPISHGLIAVAGWALLFGGIHFAARRNVRSASIVGLAVLSHWLLDAVVHRPDLPVVPGSELRVGVGLWGSVGGTVAVEGALFATGVAVYLRTTTPRDRIGRWGIAALVGFLLAIYGANLAGPPPPSVAAVAWAGQAQWLLIAAAWWVDRHRISKPARRRRSVQVLPGSNEGGSLAGNDS